MMQKNIEDLSEALKKLEDELSSFNPFKVLSVDEYELRHSNMLGWLLDPTQNHGINDEFLRTFLKRSISENQNNTKIITS